MDLQDEMDKLHLWMEANPEQFEKDWNEQFKIKNMDDLKQIEKIINAVDGKKSGFFPLNIQKGCQDRAHNPPGYMVIPQGQGYRHVCPSCGKVQIVIPPQYTL